MEKKKSLQINSPAETERHNESKNIIVTDTMDAYLNKEKELSGEIDVKTPITDNLGLTPEDGQNIGNEEAVISFDNPKLTPFMIENHSDLSSDDPGDDALKDIDEQMRGTYGGNNAFNQDDYSMITDHKKLIEFDK